MQVYWSNVKLHCQYWLKTVAHRLSDRLCLLASGVLVSSSVTTPFLQSTACLSAKCFIYEHGLINICWMMGNEQNQSVYSAQLIKHYEILKCFFGGWISTLRVLWLLLIFFHQSLVSPWILHVLGFLYFLFPAGVQEPQSPLLFSKSGSVACYLCELPDTKTSSSLTQ